MYSVYALLRTFYHMHHYNCAATKDIGQVFHILILLAITDTPYPILLPYAYEECRMQNIHAGDSTI